MHISFNGDWKTFFRSRIFKGILCGIGALVVLLLVFRAGELVGFRKANFSYRWGEGYYRTVAGPHRGFFGEPGDRDFLMSHGAFGTILTVASSSMVVQGPDNLEKVVLVTTSTVVMKFRERIAASALQPNDQVVIVGAPNDTGEIEAKLIRVMPLPPPPLPPEGNGPHRR